MFTRLSSACSACCSILCGKRQIDSEEILHSVDRIGKAHLVCTEDGTIMKVDPLLELPALKGKKIWSYQATVTLGKAVGETAFCRFSFLREHEFTYEKVHVNGRVFLLFNSILGIEKPHDAVIHWLGNTAAMAQEALGNPAVTPALYLYINICCVKTRLSAIRDHEPNWALSSVSDIVAILSDLTRHWGPIFPHITHRSVINLTNKVFLSTDLSTLTLLLQEAYLLLMSDIHERGGSILYTIDIAYTTGGKPQLFIEIKKTTPYSDSPPFTSSTPKGLEVISISPPGRAISQGAADSIKRSATAATHAQFGASGERDKLETLRIIHNIEESTFQFTFPDVTTTTDRLVLVAPEESKKGASDSAQLISVPQFYKKMTPPPIGFGSYAAASSSADISSLLGSSSPSQPVLSPIGLGAVASRALMGSLSSPSSFTPHLLIVDDEPVNRRLGLKFAGTLKHAAEALEDGAAAVLYFCRDGVTYQEVSKAYAEGQDPTSFVKPYFQANMILMDEQMKKINGSVATPIICWLTGNRIPIFPMTANASPTDLARYERVGMIVGQCIRKPFDIDTMRRVVNYARDKFFTGPI